MKLDLAAHEGRETVEAEEVVPGLAVHRSLTDPHGNDAETYSVSHVKSGLGLGQTFRTEEGARAFARSLTDLCDWRYRNPSLDEGAGATIRRLAHAAQNAEDFGLALDDGTGKRLWAVEIRTEAHVVVWAATEEEAKDIAGDACVGYDPPEPEVDIDARPLSGIGGYEHECPLGREDSLTCGQLMMAAKERPRPEGTGE